MAINHVYQQSRVETESCLIVERNEMSYESALITYEYCNSLAGFMTAIHFFDNHFDELRRFKSRGSRLIVYLSREYFLCDVITAMCEKV